MMLTSSSWSDRLVHALPTVPDVVSEPPPSSLSPSPLIPRYFSMLDIFFYVYTQSWILFPHPFKYFLSPLLPSSFTSPPTHPPPSAKPYNGNIYYIKLGSRSANLDSFSTSFSFWHRGEREWYPKFSAYKVGGVYLWY